MTTGRVTPKGGPVKATDRKPGSAGSEAVRAAAGKSDRRPHTPEASGRYTPPIPASAKVSPRWWPITMFVPWALGILIIVANYIPNFLPGATSNWYVLGGLLSILIGIIAATQYR